MTENKWSWNWSKRGEKEKEEEVDVEEKREGHSAPVQQKIMSRHKIDFVKPKPLFTVHATIG